MKIAVYLGANEGNNPIYRQAIEKLGAWIGESGHHLIYGGSKAGLMGILAQQVLSHGGKVTGVEPKFFMDMELQLDGLTELIVTDTMRERKAIMMELADVFITFPGGTGTAEEIAEVVSAGCLGHHRKIYGYYNVNGFYDLVMQEYDLMVREGFMTQENRDKIFFWQTLSEIEACIEQQ